MSRGYYFADNSTEKMMSQVQRSKYWKVASHFLASGFAAVALASVSLQARAVPELQLYIEGATYNSTSETWVIVGPGTFELWVIGNTAGSGNHGDIFGVKLSAAFATSEIGGVNLTGTTANPPLADPSTPVDPTFIQVSADGATPSNGGSSIPTHGIYGAAGTSFLEWSLGNFTLEDSPIADFGGPLFPTTFTEGKAQINAYTVQVTGYTQLHFDAYGYYVKPNNGTFQYINAPFSHDVAMIPEPEIYAMMLAGLGLMGFVARRRKQQAAAG